MDYHKRAQIKARSMFVLLDPQNRFVTMLRKLVLQLFLEVVVVGALEPHFFEIR